MSPPHSNETVALAIELVLVFMLIVELELCLNLLEIIPPLLRGFQSRHISPSSGVGLFQRWNGLS